MEWPVMNKRHRGFFLLDTIVGLIILAILGVVLGKAISWQQRSEQRLADVRMASHCAERTLLELRDGHEPPLLDVDETVRIEPAIGGAEINGFVWVRVTGSCHRSSVTLLGLAKRGAMEKH
jgi:type II secretory pathway pseudopilin PulG